MSKIIITITKKDNDPWILFKSGIASSVFSQQEINDVVKPFFDFLKSIPGYDYDSSGTTIDGNTSRTEMVFDTKENMMNAFSKLFGPDVENVVKNKNELLASRIAESNATYESRIDYEF